MEHSIVSISYHTNCPYISALASASSTTTTSYPGASTSDSLRPTSSTATNTSFASSNHSSLATLHSSLPLNAHIYSFSEISPATNNFLSKPISFISSTWRCSLHSKPSIVIHHKLCHHLDNASLYRLVFVICRSGHTSIINLLNASVSSDSIYLIYDYVPSSNLADCLCNSKNPNFIMLSSWLSRI